MESGAPIAAVLGSFGMQVRFSVVGFSCSILSFITHSPSFLLSQDDAAVKGAESIAVATRYSCLSLGDLRTLTPYQWFVAEEN